MIATAAVVAALLVGGATWLSVPDPVARWRRLAPPGPGRRSRVSRAQLVAAIAAGAVTWVALSSLLGPLTVVAAAAGAVAAGWFQARLEPAKVRVGRRRVLNDLPLTLELMAACLDAGAPLRVAVAHVAALGPAGTVATLRELDDAVRLGVHEPDAWARLSDDPEWGGVAVDMSRCAATGAAAGEVLREHATDARRRSSEARLTAARAVGVKSVLPLMTCFLPAFLLVGVVPIIASLLPRLWVH